MVDELERKILRSFFEAVAAAQPLDSTISDAKIVRNTQNQLKVALRSATHKCTCSRRSWGGHCEVCQASDRELVLLRNFYNVIRTLKKRDMTRAEIQGFLENIQEELK